MCVNFKGTWSTQTWITCASLPPCLFIFRRPVGSSISIVFAEISEVIRASFLIPIVPLQRSAGGVVPSRNACCLWAVQLYLTWQARWRGGVFRFLRVLPSFKFCWPRGREVLGSGLSFPGASSLLQLYRFRVGFLSFCVCVLWWIVLTSLSHRVFYLL